MKANLVLTFLLGIIAGYGLFYYLTGIEVALQTAKQAGQFEMLRVFAPTCAEKLIPQQQKGTSVER